METKSEQVSWEEEKVEVFPHRTLPKIPLTKKQEYFLEIIVIILIASQQLEEERELRLML